VKNGASRFASDEATKVEGAGRVREKTRIWIRGNEAPHFSVREPLVFFGWPHDDDHIALVKLAVGDLLANQGGTSRTGWLAPWRADRSCISYSSRFTIGSSAQGDSRVFRMHQGSEFPTPRARSVGDL
jgi:hypothetical protein